LFMGCEFGAGEEWNHDSALDWWLLDFPFQKGLKRWVRDLNHFLKSEPALFEHDFDPSGFSWIDCNDSQQSTLSFLRFGDDEDDVIAVACNMTPVPRYNFRLGVPKAGAWKEVLNSDAAIYGGGNVGNRGGSQALPLHPRHGRPCSMEITLPPLAAVFFKYVPRPADLGGSPKALGKV